MPSGAPKLSPLPAGSNSGDTADAADDESDAVWDSVENIAGGHTEDVAAHTSDTQPDACDADDDAADADTAEIDTAPELPDACVVATIASLEVAEAVIGTTQVRDGTGSSSPDSDINVWSWEVVAQPSDSVAADINNGDGTADFRQLVVDAYEVSLTLADSDGNPACEAATAAIVGTAPSSLHVELTWDTPGDEDQTDEGPGVGADLDLHFMHTLYAASGPDLDGDGAPDGWFDQPFDVFWFNLEPNWGSFDPSIDDEPRMPFEDSDGAGPESVYLNLGEDGVTCTVCVHYW